MKKFIMVLISIITLAVSRPVLASDAPTGGASPAQVPAATGGSDIGTWVLIALLGLGSLGIIVLAFRQKKSIGDKQHDERSAAYSRELARISSTLLAALVALVTFLLVVGVQNSVRGYTTELYTAIILLGISLVIYAAVNIVRETAIKGGAKVTKFLIIMRGLQQLVFVGSIIAVVWFVVSYAQLVIKPPAAQSDTTQQQSSGQ